MTPNDAQLIRFTVWDTLNQRDVATLFALDRPDAERTMQRLGYSRTRYRVHGILDGTAGRAAKPRKTYRGK